MFIVVVVVVLLLLILPKQNKNKLVNHEYRYILFMVDLNLPLNYSLKWSY